MAMPTLLLEPADRPVYVRPKDTIRCAAYGISRMTARQAIDDLVHEGELVAPPE